MNDNELSTRYRNLLIAMAKYQKILEDKSVVLRTEAKKESAPGRRSGLYCLARAYGKHGQALRDMLRRNNATLRQLFKTTDIATVSKKEILLTGHHEGKTVAPLAKTKTPKS